MEPKTVPRNKPSSILPYIRVPRVLSRELIVFSNKWGSENLISTCKRIKSVDPYLPLYTNIKSKCIKDLYVECQDIKILKKCRENLDDTGCVKNISCK